MAKRLTKHERTVHAARVAAHNSANYARECATNGASAERRARAQAAADRDAATLAALEHHGHKPGDCERCDAADAMIEQLDAEPRKLNCAMGLGDCTGPVTHIDDKGYVYCTGHGQRRRADGVRRCRALKSGEVAKLLNGQSIRY